jgi:hypothetical protein
MALGEGGTASPSSSDELDTTICRLRGFMEAPMLASLSSRRDIPAIVLLFGDSSLPTCRFPQTFLWAYNARMSSSSSSRSSKLSTPAFELARRWGLLGRESTPLGQSANGTTEKYTARSYPSIFRNTNEHISIDKDASETKRKTLTCSGRLPTLKALF